MRAVQLVILMLSGIAGSCVSPTVNALAIEEATVADLHVAYQAGELTARDVVAAYVARIEAYDKKGPHLNSLININPHALDEAIAIDARLKTSGKLSGPLHGIPVIVKHCM